MSLDGSIFARRLFGKSLTALLFAVRFRKAYPDSGPVLVVARKSCVLQWEEELIKHFKEVSRSEISDRCRVRLIVSRDIGPAGSSWTGLTTLSRIYLPSNQLGRMLTLLSWQVGTEEVPQARSGDPSQVQQEVRRRSQPLDSSASLSCW